MNIEDELKFIMNEYIKKSNKLLNAKNVILASNLSQDKKDKKINNIHKKLRKLQDKFIKYLRIISNERNENGRNNM